MPYAFKGLVEFRSSIAPGGPPGETTVLAMNPGRRDRILAVTRWSYLEPGSLNLRVEPSVVLSLADLVPSLIEDGADISYPAPYQHIPRVRGAYLYFSGRLVWAESSESVLVRRARNPLPTCVELFSHSSLKSKFNLVAGQQVDVVVDAKHQPNP